MITELTRFDQSFAVQFPSVASADKVLLLFLYGKTAERFNFTAHNILQLACPVGKDRDQARQ